MNKREKAVAAELTRLIGCTSYTQYKSRCTGKWRGTTDYGLTFDNGCTLFISNGMAAFEQNTIEYISRINAIRANKRQFMSELTSQIEKDNLVAQSEGLAQVRLIDVDINTDINLYFLWSYLLIEVNGLQFRHTETGLNHSLCRNRLDEWLSRRAEKTWTAGAVQNPDYIIGNVRFCSTDKLYKITND